MAENEDERYFWWTLIKANAAIALKDRVFSTTEYKSTEYTKKIIENRQKISDFQLVISKYNDKTNSLKIEHAELVFKEGSKYKSEPLKVLLKELLDEVSDMKNKLSQ
ncbi:MAG: hypothetical protein II411_03130 [Lachnospiraceae bacterium]|nr:hypothetical protein [Lachnospiraceae bacterium]